MERIAKFEYISERIRLSDACGREEELASVKLPSRATGGSAGYDFFAPFDFTLKNGESIVIPTGVRVKISEGWLLQIFPRSGLGFKYRLQLDNTVGIIDSDYYNAENEGHIKVKLSNMSLKDDVVFVKRGQAFCQGVFTQYGITFDDCQNAERVGGFGSTDKQ